jgi:hypothetical protein
MEISENNQEKELRELFREISLNSPSPGFTGKVMDILEAETTGAAVPAREPLLGKRFWMLALLFLVPLALLPAFGSTKESFLMMLADRYLSGWHLPSLPDWHLADWHLPTLQGLGEAWSLFGAKAETVPLTMAWGMLAIIVLLLAERTFSRKKELVTP